MQKLDSFTFKITVSSFSKSCAQFHAMLYDVFNSVNVFMSTICYCRIYEDQ